MAVDMTDLTAHSAAGNKDLAIHIDINVFDSSAAGPAFKVVLFVAHDSLSAHVEVNIVFSVGS